LNRIFAATYRDDTSNVPFVRSLEAALRTEGFRLSIVFFDEHREKAVVEDLLNSPNYCDGLVLLTGFMDETLAAKIIDSKVAHVCLDLCAERLGLNSVSENSVDGMRQAILHLKRLDHEHITFLGAAQGSRYGFFKAAIAETNMPVAEPIHIDESANWFNRDTACTVFGRWLDNGRTASAVICQTDGIALGAIEAMRQRGLTAGREISIVGHDNIEERDDRIKGEPTLTTVDDGIDILGKRCGELLLNQVLRGQRQIVHEYLPVVKLVVRQTTGARNQD
jgi:DNA-binding LacI/PurR family transcriptional regulator